MMKRKAALLACLILCLAAFAGCGKTEPERAGKGLSEYKITAELDADKMCVTATQCVAYVNRYDFPLEVLAFNLHANGFREGAKFPPVSAELIPQAYPNGLSYGGIEIHSAAVNGKAVRWEIGGEDENALTVPLCGELFPDERVSVELKFTVQLANIKHRLGYADNTVNLGNWYPVVCVAEAGEFCTYPYYANGDPFYSDVANYQVEFTLPDTYTLAASGAEKAVRKADGKATHVLEASAVRDFALVAGKNLKRIETKSDGVNILYYYSNDTEPSRSLEIAADAVSEFNRLFGRYPYPVVSVTEADFVHGGMEYPGLIYISEGLKPDVYREVIVHELAHQWWYAAVGSNEVEHAWMDEGLTEFSTALFYECNPEYGRTLERFAQEHRAGYQAYLKLLAGMNLAANTAIDRPLSAFKTEYEYVVMTYSRGMLLFNDLYRLIGQDAFLAGARKYFEFGKFRNNAPCDLVGYFEQGAGRSLAGWFDSYLSGKSVG